VEIPEIEYTRSADVSIAYQTFGGGAHDLVFVPQFSNLVFPWSNSDWRGLYERLAAFSRVIIFDKRGTGLSDRPRDLGPLETRMDDIRAVNRRELSRFRGHELDTAGDGFFATFDGPARAISCARAIVASVGELELAVRAGVHTGECELQDGKVTGIAVNIGARVAALAGPEEVLVSSTVKDLVGLRDRVRGTR
jgi:pimeloyl-ACP methyl ester carboxylesterase